jgi:hypothetical protein
MGTAGFSYAGKVRFASAGSGWTRRPFSMIRCFADSLTKFRLRNLSV